jgi:hypothetical protein
MFASNFFSRPFVRAQLEKLIRADLKRHGPLPGGLEEGDVVNSVVAEILRRCTFSAHGGAGRWGSVGTPEFSSVG